MKAMLALALLACGLLAGCAAPADACAGIDAGPVELSVETQRYTYAPGTDAPLEVPRCAVVTLHVTSGDVTHGFAIDGYRVNEEIPAGETITITFTADKPGDFAIYCTVFCGAGHPQHKGTLHVAA